MVRRLGFLVRARGRDPQTRLAALALAATRRPGV